MIHKSKDERYFQITLKEFSDLVARFSKGVEKGWFEKVEYSTWRQLSKICNSDDYSDVTIKIVYDIEYYVEGIELVAFAVALLCAVPLFRYILSQTLLLYSWQDNRRKSQWKHHPG